MSVLKRMLLPVVCVLFVLSAAIPAQAQAQLTAIPPVTAEQAFDAVQLQQDPLSGAPKTVYLVDIRSRAEFYWVGTAAAVTQIVLADDNSTIVPDYGKVKLVDGGKFLVYQVNQRNKRMLVRKVKSLSTQVISVSVPYKLWNESTGTMSLNPTFLTEITTLAGPDTVVILFCRSGDRSDSKNVGTLITPGLFDAVYEIEQTDGGTGNGGFEGNVYGNVYNGYRGFPGRDTDTQLHLSGAWKDAGLPIAIGVNPVK